MNLAAVDWDHFSAYMTRAAGRMTIVALLFAAFFMGYFSLYESNPEAARTISESWILYTESSIEVNVVEVLFVFTTTWIVIPLLQALQAFLPLREVFGK